jgi:uncharacterized membrane protein YuzA (DUF378 family)
VSEVRKPLNALDWIALALLVIGGINWGLVGLFQFDLVAAIFGGASSIVSRIIYIAVGLAAVFVAADAFTFEHRTSETRAAHPTT